MRVQEGSVQEANLLLAPLILSKLTESYNRNSYLPHLSVRIEINYAARPTNGQRQINVDRVIVHNKVLMYFVWSYFTINYPFVAQTGINLVSIKVASLVRNGL